jgi:hypothetical protein
MFRHLQRISTSLASRRATRSLPDEKPRRRGGARLTLEFLEDRLAPAVLTVNTLAGAVDHSDNFLSLSEAVAVVNAGSTAGLTSGEAAVVSGTLGNSDKIQFAPGLTAGGPQTITPANELTLKKAVAIVGLGADKLTISGGNAHRVFSFEFAKFSLSNMTIANGLSKAAAGGAGGGILVQSYATLTISGSTISQN